MLIALVMVSSVGDVVAMSGAALKLRNSEDAAVSGRQESVFSLAPVESQDPEVLAEWARSVTAAAERRVAVLERRLAQLESLITSDELTGLLNRRGFMGAFTRANAAAKRGGPAGIIVVCDLNGFKQVNDQLGHAQGDELLRQLGAILRNKTRKMDAAARLGGDEFALMLIGMTMPAAKRKCEWLGKVIGTIGVGASFGLAAFDGSESEDAVLHRADMAMYEDKRHNASAASERSAR
jgi:diguanylate cyclase (GGDEF)-like protein